MASDKAWLPSEKTLIQDTPYRSAGVFNVPDMVFLPIFEAFETDSVAYDVSADFLS
jgi:hypothetical protein